MIIEKIREFEQMFVKAFMDSKKEIELKAIRRYDQIF